MSFLHFQSFFVLDFAFRQPNKFRTKFRPNMTHGLITGNSLDSQLLFQLFCDYILDVRLLPVLTQVIVNDPTRILWRVFPRGLSPAKGTISFASIFLRQA